MPTENRSSNTEMVSVPRDELERLVKLLSYQAHPYPSPHAEYWQGILDAPAQQQGEPVVSQCPLCCQPHEQVPVGRAGGQQANGCDVDFTTWRCEGCGGSWTGDPADPGEVERLRAELEEWKKRCQYNADTAHDVGHERDTLLAQLAKAHALLRLARQFVINGVDLGYIQMPDADTPDPAHDLVPKIDAALCAGAEPTDECAHSYANGVGCPECGMEFGAEPTAPECKYCGDTGQIMVGRSGDASDGNAPVLEPCEDCERGAPVERDERAEFEMAYQVAVDHGWSNVKSLARQLWDARAALERKP